MASARLTDACVTTGQNARGTLFTADRKRST
jgi:hypothetical protein